MGSATVDVSAIYSKGLLSNRVGRLIVTDGEAVFLEARAPIIGGGLEIALQKFGNKAIRMPFETITRVGRSKRGLGEVVEIESAGATHKFMASWKDTATPLAAALETAGYAVHPTADGWTIEAATAGS